MFRNKCTRNYDDNNYHNVRKIYDRELTFAKAKFIDQSRLTCLTYVYFTNMQFPRQIGIRDFYLSKRDLTRENKF